MDKVQSRLLPYITVFKLAMDKIISSMLILLWTYTGLEKLIRFESSRKAFHNQTFPAELAEVLAYAIPITEMLLALLLFFSITRWWGYLGSILLLTVFTTYVGLIWVGAFPRVPCNCAGIMESLGWEAHYFLNIAFILLSMTGIWLDRGEAQFRTSTLKF
ncbi:MauE/DoxX family redox-associated membrane protein [Algoriphagus antarcticus]|nr:MauE/DoxX family redox-associated membrane protein [Algoriphagus antarcticus]